MAPLKHDVLLCLWEQKLCWKKLNKCSTCYIHINKGILILSQSVFCGCFCCNYCYSGVSSGWWSVIKKTQPKALATVNQSLSPVLEGLISALSGQLFQLTRLPISHAFSYKTGQQDVFSAGSSWDLDGNYWDWWWAKSNTTGEFCSLTRLPPWHF